MGESGFVEVEVEGGRLYYEAEGDGPPVLLIHGGLGTLRMWDEQVPRLAERHRVIRYDTRGFGRTESDDVESDPFPPETTLVVPSRIPRAGDRKQWFSLISTAEPKLSGLRFEKAAVFAAPPPPGCAPSVNGQTKYGSAPLAGVPQPQASVRPFAAV